MDFLPLAVIFFITGLLAIVYYRFVPSATVLRNRLPNKVTPAALFLVVVIGVAAWYVFRTYSGSYTVFPVFILLFALLFFESLFLLLMRWMKINAVVVLVSMIVTALLFWVQITFPTFIVLNSIIVVATLGAATLLIRLGYLRTIFLFVVAILWTAYDILLVEFILPSVTREVSVPTPTFLFPSVTVGQISLGSGDFMFLTLFTLVLLRDFGLLPSIILVVGEVTGLLITGFLLPEKGFLVPFLVIMTPIFFLVYMASQALSKSLPITPRNT